MTPEPPKFRPLERFWPYAELPEQPTDEELAAALDNIMLEHDEGDLWLFGYGSLMWKPEREMIDARPALLNGWHRRFCLWQWRYRGSRARPGLVPGV